VHEYALAAYIARRVEAEAGRSSARRLAGIDVEIGGLARLDPDAIAFWLREALGETVTARARIRVLRAPVSLTCLRCGHQRSVVPYDQGLPTLDPACRRCPQCQSEEVKLDGKAGCRISALRFRP